MSETSNSTQSYGCGGCVSLIISILVICAIIWGLPTTWGTLNIDLIPPGIYLK